MNALPPMASGLTTQILSPHEALETHGGGWQLLAEHAANGDCFATPAFFRAWLATLSADVTPQVLTVVSGTRLIGLLPIMSATVWRGPRGVARHDFAPSDAQYLGAGPLRFCRLRQVSPIVSMPAAWVQRGPLVAPDQTQQVFSLLARTLADLKGWDVLAIPADEGDDQSLWLQSLKAVGLSPWVQGLDREISGIVNLRPFDELVATTNRNFRKNIRRAKSAAGQAGIGFFIHDDRSSVLEHWSMLAQVAQRSWKSQPSKDLLIPYQGAQDRFFSTLVKDPDPGVSPILAIAMQTGRPIAALLSLRTGSRLTAVLIFHDGSLPKANVGLLLLGKMIDWACDRGLGSYDLNASHPWLRHLVNGSRRQNIVAAFGKHPRGRVFGAISALARKQA